MGQAESGTVLLVALTQMSFAAGAGVADHVRERTLLGEDQQQGEQQQA